MGGAQVQSLHCTIFFLRREGVKKCLYVSILKILGILWGLESRIMKRNFEPPPALPLARQLGHPC